MLITLPCLAGHEFPFFLWRVRGAAAGGGVSTNSRQFYCFMPVERRSLALVLRCCSRRPLTRYGALCLLISAVIFASQLLQASRSALAAPFESTHGPATPGAGGWGLWDMVLRVLPLDSGLRVPRHGPAPLHALSVYSPGDAEKLGTMLRQAQGLGYSPTVVVLSPCPVLGPEGEACARIEGAKSQQLRPGVAYFIPGSPPRNVYHNFWGEWPCSHGSGTLATLSETIVIRLTPLQITRSRPTTCRCGSGWRGGP
jgi:hypothetical protein